MVATIRSGAKAGPRSVRSERDQQADHQHEHAADHEHLEVEPAALRAISRQRLAARRRGRRTSSCTRGQPGARVTTR